jgi:hypothetical protein
VVWLPAELVRRDWELVLRDWVLLVVVLLAGALLAGALPAVVLWPPRTGRPKRPVEEPWELPLPVGISDPPGGGRMSAGSGGGSFAAL